MQNEKWLEWAVELQSLAQAGMYYSKDVYDIQRFERIREIAAEMVSEGSGCGKSKGPFLLRGGLSNTQNRMPRSDI